MRELLLSSLFFRYGILEEMASDNGSQYISQEMKDFAKMYGFEHITSSPHYPQGNGQADRMVRTIKNLLKNKEDPYRSLLSYRVHLLPVAGWPQLNYLWAENWELPYQCSKTF